MTNIRGIEILVCGIFFCFLLSCGKYDKRMEEVLSLSGENCTELETALKHYQDSALKKKAMEFLVVNMPGLFVVDTTSLGLYRPFYQSCDSVRLLYKETQWTRWSILIDSLWNVHQKRNALQQIKYTPLLKIITAKQLIAEVDMAFDAWQQNTFTKNCSFEDFCEYILPCWRGSNFVLDDARLRFSKRHGGNFFTNKTRTLFDETDSVLSQYRKTDYNTFRGADIASLSVESLIQMGGGKCIERGIMNSLLLSSLGVLVAIDFVPHWGNNDATHSWNVLIADGRSYAFDPFDLQSGLVYNKLYSNTGMYEEKGQGEFRVPKIYRKTYSTQLENTLVDKGVALDDIPSLFRNCKMKDVSTSYFEATDVTVNLDTPIPEDAKYAYLCVFDVNGWKPVQFGKIDGKEVLFQAMGRNIVYLPAYYKKGLLLPAASPFCLKTDGRVMILNETRKLVDSLVTRAVVIKPFSNRNYLKCMSGSSLVRLDKNGNEDTLCRLSGILPVKRNVYKVDVDASTRFVRVNLPSDSIALGELSFYTSQGKIEHVRVISPLQVLSVDEKIENIFDNFNSTCYRGKARNKVVDIDLGKEYELTSVIVSPYVMSQIFPDDKYELYYWKNGDWKLLEIQQGSQTDLVFRNVPDNALFRLVHVPLVKSKKIVERIFLYKDGEVIWM